MVLEDDSKVRFSAIKKIYPKAHLEATKGTKEQAENYIEKKGKFADSDEKVIYIARHGEIKACQGQRRDLQIIEEMLLQDKTPKEIMKSNFSYRRYEKMIRQAYNDKRLDLMPFKRDIEVYWHVGEPGSGKTYVAVQIAEEKGHDDVYMYVDYESGGLDMYQSESILFMDEFRGNIRFGVLMGLLQGYKIQAHARYSNVVPMWNEVHIATIFPPEEVYKRMVTEDRGIDSYEQLKRRITAVVYHYIDEDGKYRSFQLPMVEYLDYGTLKYMAEQAEQMQLPSFDDLNEVSSE